MALEVPANDQSLLITSLFATGTNTEKTHLFYLEESAVMSRTFSKRQHAKLSSAKQEKSTKEKDRYYPIHVNTMSSHNPTDEPCQTRK